MARAGRNVPQEPFIQHLYNGGGLTADWAFGRDVARFQKSYLAPVMSLSTMGYGF
jgi:hypothetical protein